MDQELEKKIEEARQAGYSDEEINQYIQSLNQPPSTTQPNTFADGTPVVPPNQPMNRGEEYAGLAEGALLPLGKALTTGAELYAGKKLVYDPLIDAIKNRGPSGPVAPSGTPPAAPPSAISNAPKFTPEPVRPVAPPAAEPMLNPQWDEALKKQPKSPSMISRGAEYASKIRELAAQKALQIAPTAARVGAGATAALMPGNVGQNYNVPQVGPLRGSEINPETRRPWTPQELARYNAQYNR
jgi:hypothetical protein